tara:strand:+ start:102 stop:290 length:189 start_codon:yes stop_codon:yes gene_type:complete
MSKQYDVIIKIDDKESIQANYLPVDLTEANALLKCYRNEGAEVHIKKLSNKEVLHYERYRDE